MSNEHGTENVPDEFVVGGVLQDIETAILASDQFAVATSLDESPTSLILSTDQGMFRLSLERVDY